MAGSTLPAGCACGARQQALLQARRPLRRAFQAPKGQPKGRAAAAVSRAGREQAAHEHARSQHAHAGPSAGAHCVSKAAVALLAALQLGGAPLALQLAASGPAHAVLNSPNARIARRCARPPARLAGCTHMWSVHAG